MTLTFEYTSADVLAAEDFVLRRSKSFNRGLSRRGMFLPSLVVALGVAFITTGEVVPAGIALLSIGLVWLFFLPKINRRRLAKARRKLMNDLAVPNTDLLTLELQDEGLKYRHTSAE